jgi:fructose-bisphosphate aldolase, class I
VRVDAGARPLAGTRGETITEGLDGLLPRLREYAALGARFASWRAVVRIGAGAPSPLAVRANAHALGRFASACQDAGLVALAEPAVLTDGSRSLGRCETVTSVVLLELMTSLDDYEVDFRGVVLRLTMVRPDSDSATPAQAAEATISTLGGLPTALAGVAFSSGGQHPERATGTLAMMQHALSLWPLTLLSAAG